MNAYVLSLGAVLLVSLGPLLILLVYREQPSKRVTRSLLSLAMGSLLGDAVFHLIPEALGVERLPLGPLSALLAGIAVFFIGERFLQHYHHGHGHGEDTHDQNDNTTMQHGHHPPMGLLVIISDLLHNFVDGLAIGVSFGRSPGTGYSTTVAVLLHEIPHELGDFAILRSVGYSCVQVVGYNLAASSGALLGAALGCSVGNVKLQPYLLGFTAGNFVYIALTDLAPELLKHPEDGGRLEDILQYVLLMIGAGSMLALKLVYEG